MADNQPTIRVDHVEVQLIYLMTMAVYLFVRDIDRRLGLLFRNGKFNRQKMRLFEQIGKKVKELYFLEEELDKDMAYTTENRPGEFQLYQEEANEVARLMLLFVEKCGQSVENRDAVFSFLRGLENGAGIVQEKDIDRFYLKK